MQRTGREESENCCPQIKAHTHIYLKGTTSKYPALQCPQPGGIIMFLLTFALLWISVSGGTDYLQNVALRGRATQSTNYETFSAAINAIDGNVDPIYRHGSCFQSESELSPWWRLDLLETHRISHITITNRGDCCADLISGAEILIGDSLANHGNNNARCVKITTIPLAGTQTFQCDGMTGRYVNIVKPGVTGYLSFCEVEVFGSPLNCRCYP
ncbi:fucolectin-like [Anomaloglossus baeobatrachus]|uniref:fucolectin-like n=1 Tax=Anomaloglossus baeobatrachus TaxID=238106 RepID=UPI003F501E29